MKKYFFILIFLINTPFVYADQIVKYVDLDSILKNSNKGKDIVNELNKINSKNLDELNYKKDELKKLDNEIKKLSNVVSENELQNKIDDLKKKINTYKQFQKNKSNEINEIKNKKIENFFRDILPYIEKYMKDNNIAIIFDKKNIFIADSNYDITREIIELLNKQL